MHDRTQSLRLRIFLVAADASPRNPRDDAARRTLPKRLSFDRHFFWQRILQHHAMQKRPEKMIVLALGSKRDPDRDREHSVVARDSKARPRRRPDEFVFVQADAHGFSYPTISLQSSQIKQQYGS